MRVCKKGHELTPDTTYVAPSGYSTCYTCKLESDRRYSAKNREKARAKANEWYLGNKNRALEYQKQWRQKNCEKVKITRAADKSKRRCAGVFPKENYQILLEAFGTWCPYCETDGHNLTVDHITPISKGGDNSIENLMPCCPSCNSSKNDKYIGEWRSELSFLSLPNEV